MTGPSGLTIRPGRMVRGKKPEANLRRGYRKTLWVSSAASAGLHLVAFVLFPSFDVKAYAKAQAPVIIELEQIPETRQEKKPPPPIRPVVPIATDSPDVPDDATIEMTEFDLYDLPPPPSAVDFEQEVELEEEEEETVHLQKNPVTLVKVEPVYSSFLRRSGIEGRVTVVVSVNEEGRVDSVVSIEGNKLFYDTVRDAVLQYEFEPAIQNDRPVPVTVELKFTFELNEG